MFPDSLFNQLNLEQKYMLIFILAALFYILTVRFYVWTNKYDKTNTKTIVQATLYGAVAFLIINGGSFLIYFFIFADVSRSLSFTIQSSPIRIVLVTPLVEEIVKDLFVLLFYRHRPESMDTPLDGLIIGALIGSSFGFLENLLFGISAVNNITTIWAVNVTILRGTFLIVGHPLFAGLFGMGLIYNKMGKRVHVLRYFFIGLMLHYIWNFLVILRVFVPNILLFYYYGFLFIDFIVCLTYLTLVTLTALDLEKELVKRGYYKRKREYYIVQ